MKLHANAKTSPKMRQLIVDRVTRDGWTQRQAAEAAGISVRTVAKWVARARRGARLIDGPSRPHHSPRQLPAEITAAIVALRHTRATSWAISARVGVPRSTVTRVLARAGLNRLRLLEPQPLIQRYEWPHAGDLLHLDIKPLGRIRGVGHRIHGNRQLQEKGAVGSTRTWPSTTPPAWPMWKCAGRNDVAPATRFSAAPCDGLRGAAFACAAS
jgi:transposase-like protein